MREAVEGCLQCLVTFAYKLLGTVRSGAGRRLEETWTQVGALGRRRCRRAALAGAVVLSWFLPERVQARAQGVSSGSWFRGRPIPSTCCLCCLAGPAMRRAPPLPARPAGAAPGCRLGPVGGFHG